MRAASIFLTGLLATFSAAQSTTVPAPVTSTDPSTAAQSSASEIVRCLDACDDSDVTCRAKCIAVPNPTEEQVNDTNECVAACPQGNGTESDILAYGNCVDGCIGQHYFTSTGTPQATGGSTPGSGNTNNNNNNNNEGGAENSSGTSGNEPSRTGGAATVSSSSAAAPGDVLRVTGSAVGLFGFLAAILAL